MKKLVFTMVVVAAGVASAVSFSYQGALRTAEGEPIPVTERNKTITFRLYDTPTGTDALWGRMIAVHLDDNGLFNVELSNDTGSIVGGVKTNDLAWVLSQYPGKEHDLYIGLDVSGSSGEIRPRQKLLNVPAAAFAADVATAKGDFTVRGKATFASGCEIKDTLSVAKGLTVNQGLTVDSGSLTISSGKLIVPGGGVIPKGGIIMWSGRENEVPEGWVLCNGSNGTPDLRGRFIVGEGNGYAHGATGGEEVVTLYERHIPSHDHAFQAIFHVFETEANETTSDYYDLGYGVRWVGTRNVQTNLIEGGGSFQRPNVGDYKNSEQDTNVRVSAFGGGQPHENRPPYYALCFIMKL